MTNEYYIETANGEDYTCYTLESAILKAAELIKRGNGIVCIEHYAFDGKGNQISCEILG